MHKIKKGINIFKNKLLINYYYDMCAREYCSNTYSFKIFK